MQILLKGLSKTFVFSQQFTDLNQLTSHISEITHIPTENYYLTLNGRMFSNSSLNENVDDTLIININLKLLGGKVTLINNREVLVLC
jgi:hypothetical protein